MDNQIVMEDGFVPLKKCKTIIHHQQESYPHQFLRRANTMTAAIPNNTKEDIKRIESKLVPLIESDNESEMDECCEMEMDENRPQKIAKLHTDLIQINEVFKEFQNIIGGTQQTNIDTIVENAHESCKTSKQALNHVIEAKTNASPTHDCIIC